MPSGTASWPLSAWGRRIPDPGTRGARRPAQPTQQGQRGLWPWCSVSEAGLSPPWHWVSSLEVPEGRCRATSSVGPGTGLSWGHSHLPAILSWSRCAQGRPCGQAPTPPGVRAPGPLGLQCPQGGVTLCSQVGKGAHLPALRVTTTQPPRGSQGTPLRPSAPGSRPSWPRRLDSHMGLISETTSPFWTGTSGQGPSQPPAPGSTFRWVC